MPKTFYKRMLVRRTTPPAQQNNFRKPEPVVIRSMSCNSHADYRITINGIIWAPVRLEYPISNTPKNEPNMNSSVQGGVKKDMGYYGQHGRHSPSVYIQLSVALRNHSVRSALHVFDIRKGLRLNHYHADHHRRDYQHHNISSSATRIPSGQNTSS